MNPEDWNCEHCMDTDDSIWRSADGWMRDGRTEWLDKDGTLKLLAVANGTSERFGWALCTFKAGFIILQRASLMDFFCSWAVAAIASDRGFIFVSAHMHYVADLESSVAHSLDSRGPKTVSSVSFSALRILWNFSHETCELVMFQWNVCLPKFVFVRIFECRF